MHIYAELWNARPAWNALSKEERGAFVQKVGQNVQALAERGIEPLYFAISDPDVPLRAEYDYIAIWKMPDEEGARELERNVEEAGWHEYFEQVNARGRSVPPEQIFGDMIDQRPGATHPTQLSHS